MASDLDLEFMRALDELTASETIPNLESHHITIQRTADHLHTSCKSAKTKIMAWEASGEIRPVGKRKIRGHVVDAWERVSAETHNRP